ncbi:MAG: RAMP superfamily protein [Synechococcaceae bacterium WB8_1B_136]|nr:RAMP superfamily protein [Synechococcaceae bacterium WB8_1B_136]
MSKASSVPIEFRAQIDGRAQRQYIKKPNDPPPGWKPDIQRWIDQWVERIDHGVPFSAEGLHIVEAQIDWRLISNSGTDEGVIRPVIGAGGWPLLPGSGIKGLFRRACPADKVQRWCGSHCASGDLSQGLLRFHGAWPADDSWTQGLLDVAHPQQNWQVGFKADQRQNGHSAFGVVSLHRPLLKIGLSSTQPLDDAEWALIEATLRKALERGLGGRTVAGYGSSGRIQGDVLFQCGLEGQGPSAKLLDETPEFRPTMFRAAIRGMALRLFGGITDELTTLQVVGELFGSLSREEKQNVGLLATAYTNSQTSLGRFGSGSWAQPVFATSGQLQWRQARGLRKGEDALLVAELLAQLHGLVMTLGGFGRGWRRPDHRIFLPSYYKSGRPRASIGTHWQWLKPSELPEGVHVQSADDIEHLLRQAQGTARRWLAAVNRKPGHPAPWREILAPDRVGIWVRVASDPEDAAAITWFHEEPRPDREGLKDPRDLKKTDIGGRVNLVGRIWNRLLPLSVEDGGSRPTSATAGAPFARPSAPGGALARPASPMARPAGGAAALARPGRAGAAAAGSRQQQLSGPVSINAWNGPYLESVVLFVDPRDQGHGPALRRRLDEGGGAEFRRVKFTNP